MEDWFYRTFGFKDFKIFISHSLKDAQWLDDYLAGVVTNLGAKYVMAEHDFSLSTEGSISMKIAGMIDSSHAVLAVLSESGNESKFVQQEIGYAHGKGKPVIALIKPNEKGEVEKPGFLYDKDVIVYKDQAELKDLRGYLQKVLKSAWDRKNQGITGKIVIGGIVGGLLLLGRMVPDNEQ